MLHDFRARELTTDPGPFNMTRHPSTFILHPCPRRGFTLLELMISVAIMLFLVIGINQVFSTTSATVGAGQAASALTRDQKAASTVFYSDWQGAATIDSPAIIIHSEALPMFLNKADAASDADGLPLTVNQQGAATATVSAFTYNYRNHRADQFSFFSRGDFPRQTGDGSGSLVSPLASNEAWISYGHLMLPNNGITRFYAPGEADAAAPGDKNDNNFYASQWVLGRVAMLLRYNSAAAPTFSGYYGRVPASPANLTPLAGVTTTAPGISTISQSRFDVADRFRQDILSQADPNWWQKLIYRFQCDPYSVLDRATADSAAFAKTTPYFLPGCTQFMVEYAGDFVTQDANQASATYGEVKTDSGGLPIIQPDGIIDFYIDKSADPGDSTKWVRRTRWFGLGRDLTINGTAADDGDVRPFRDSWPASPAIPRQAFEKDIVAPSGGSPGVYTCVFGPTDVKPKMIRITVTITDPNDRLANGQTYEYVLGSP